MADKDKRNSVAAKVATPKASLPLGDSQETLAKAIGARIKVTTVAPHSQTYEGSLYSACPVLSIIAVDTRAPSANNASRTGDYNFIPISKIQSFQITAPSAINGSDSNAVKTAPSVGPVDLKRLKQREEERIRKLKEEEQDKGQGVTKEAQAIFDSFKRINMPIRWHNQEMILHEAVIITPPYRVEDCKAAKDKQEVLNRVKKVLEGEKRKLKERESRNATPVPRKGG
ncbi:Hypothetical protein R9X50_00344700 [Acrodontium crateriforme]|uniref:AD domain-containing protein n=1 Tax=Acrodontium crateriforme TaxID=150365 RepID=A0AAQ3M921_9PEZI|nr:Hypothetical protein R9X50_00344700 [Acrodontium crateriforme]